MRRLTRGFARAVVVATVALSFGLAGVAGEALAQSDTMMEKKQ